MQSYWLYVIFAIAGLTNAPVLPLSLDLCIETYVLLWFSTSYLSIILELIQFRKLLLQGFSWLLGKRERNLLLLFVWMQDFDFFYSQLGSILSIVILPNFTRAPTAHQMSIQKCEVQDGKLSDIRDYSSNWRFITDILNLCLVFV